MILVFSVAIICYISGVVLWAVITLSAIIRRFYWAATHPFPHHFQRLSGIVCILMASWAVCSLLWLPILIMKVRSLRPGRF